MNVDSAKAIAAFLESVGCSNPRGWPKQDRVAAIQAWAREMHQIVQAYADGKKLEHSRPGDIGWASIDHPSFSDSPECYRIKQPKLKSLVDLPMPCVVRPKSNPRLYVALVASVTASGMSIGGDRVFSNLEQLKDMEWSRDGSVWHSFEEYTG